MATKPGVVRISGRGSNVDFTIDDSAPFDQVAEGLREYLVENRGLWSNGTIGVNAGRWMRSWDQLSRIKRIIESGSGLTVGRFWCAPTDLDGRLEGPDWDAQSEEAPGNAGAEVITPPPDRRLPNEMVERRLSASRLKLPAAGSSRKGLPSEALFVKTTFRSGESIRYPGDVVVLADVNPGAEISAEGDIVVFGSLRGFAHAGSAGNTKASIIALELDSPRIQIGPHTGLPPTVGDGPGPNPMRTVPRIAYVRRRSIYVAPYAGRFARYTRGTQYDG